MATKKQLAALKRGRETMAKNRALKKVTRKATLSRSGASARARSKAIKSKVQKRKAPAKLFIVEVRLRGNKTGYLTKAGGLDTNWAVANKSRESTAEVLATAFFNKHKEKLLWVKVVPVKKPEGAGYKKNPVPESSRVHLKRAAELFEDFTGHDAEYYDSVPVNIPKAALRVGLCDGLMYETIRDGKTEHYVHKFKKFARPALAVSSDGKQLLLIGGNFAFTERGIVDN